MALNKIAFLFGEEDISEISLNSTTLPSSVETAKTLMTLISEATSDTNNTVAVIVGKDYDAVEYFYCNYVEDSGPFQTLTLGTHKIKLHERDGISLTY